MVRRKVAFIMNSSPHYGDRNHRSTTEHVESAQEHAKQAEVQLEYGQGLLKVLDFMVNTLQLTVRKGDGQ